LLIHYNAQISNKTIRFFQFALASESVDMITWWP